MTACPTCKKAAAKDGNKVFPFCCERCQLVDLGRWLDEAYRIPEATEAKPPAPGDPET
ncbi:MAG: DNA gyrase inhibitor YacG [Kofleriaceae bacterium]